MLPRLSLAQIAPGRVRAVWLGLLAGLALGIGDGRSAAADELAAGANPTARHIQRSMKAMEEGSEPVRILFYGQSITQGNWRDLVIEGLRERYPKAQLEVVSRPIGGFQAHLLAGTAHADLYPFYPDLLIFHVYGDLNRYEEIIARTRATTTSEIIIATDHVSNRNKDSEEDARVARIAAIAEKYRCMLVDIRSKWKAHLAKTGKTASDLLRDSVHPNDAGNELYAEIMLADIRREPGLGDNPDFARQVRHVSLDAPDVVRRPDGAIDLAFQGNRVVAISEGTGGVARVTVNGKAPSELPGTWVHSRVSGPPKGIRQPRPAITHVGFETVPVEEKWTLTVLPGDKSDGSEIRFAVEGSVTGKDGEGVSTQPFRSNSGRVTIQPGAWTLAMQLNRAKAKLPAGFQVRWQTAPLVPNTFAPGEKGGRTFVVQGLPNGRHTLRLEPIEGSPPPGIASFIVYEPDPAILIPPMTQPPPDSDVENLSPED